MEEVTRDGVGEAARVTEEGGIRASHVVAQISTRGELAGPMGVVKALRA